jgi:hypothetical protein
VIFIQADCEPSAAELAELPPDDLAKWHLHQNSLMRPTSLAKVEHPHSGTGFLIRVTDDRLPKEAAFIYLVTNRHVAQPGIEEGHPCKVFDYTLLVNSKEAVEGTNSILQTEHLGSGVSWTYPEDDSVDLAITPVTPGPTADYLTISIDQFVTADMISQHQVVEGDPVLFAGLFIWFHGSKRLEPIVRSGALAMLPSEPVQTTLRKLGQVYFADTFSFGGNSGSPILVDVRRFGGQGGYDFKLLGVVAGFVPESNDFTLQVATDYTGTIKENSGICVIVPVEELRKLLLSPDLKRERDEAVANFLKNQKQ